MKKLRYVLKDDNFVNRFITTGIYAEPQRFKKTILSGRVNEWLKKGFAIHENPCRKEFVAKRQEELPPYVDISQYEVGQETEVFGKKNRLRTYFPFGNVGYEESGFYYCPTYLRSYCYVELEAEEEEKAEFHLETCGGVTIWMDDEFITDYIPFTRNMVKSTSVVIPLAKGSNKLVVCLDDLAERDTDYYFRLQYRGTQKLHMALPVPETVDCEKVFRYEDILNQIYFEKETYLSEPVVLTLPFHEVQDDTIKLIISYGEFVEKMSNASRMDRISEYTLTPGQKQMTLLDAYDIVPGYYHFVFELSEGPIQIRRKVGNQVSWKEFLVRGSEDSLERKNEFLKTLMKYGSDNAYKAAAYFKQGVNCEKAEQIILEEIDGVKQRQDCSDFHFTTILYSYYKFGDKMSEKLKQEIEETALGYRYWIDEPGDDVMWFFSENHALLFHTCQFLAGRLFPDELFTNSQKMGTEVNHHGRELLDEWFDGFFNEFITEWNSSAYIPVDVHGLATIYNITDDTDELHQKAKRALDMICYSLAVNEHNNAVMTSFGRTYEKEMKGNYEAGTTALLYLFYNSGYLTRSGIGNISVALGDYEAPAEYRQYIELEEDENLIFENTQGFEQHVNLYLHKNNHVLLSTAVGFKPFQKGYQEHIMQATIDETAQVFINHPGESHPYGSGRPNFWSGNGVLPLGLQYKNFGILVYDIPETERIDYTHAYIPLSEFRQYSGREGSVVVAKNGAFIGVRALNGCTLQKNGPAAYREFISPGRKNIWLVKVVTADEYEDMNAFLDEMREISIEYQEGGSILIADGDNHFKIGPDQSFTLNGETVHNYPLPVEGRIRRERK